MFASLFHSRASQTATLHKPVPPSVLRAIGIAFLIGAIALLLWNERRMSLPFFAQKALPLQANTPERIDTVTYVAATGLITAATDIGDEPYLPPGPFIAISRMVEMYSWQESFPDTGGVAAYEKVWTDSPQDSSQFQQPGGHSNPPKQLSSRLHRVLAAKVGIFDVDMPLLNFPLFRPLELTPGSVSLAGGTLRDGMIYRGNGTADQPEVGDLRIRYGVIPQAQTMTLFGAVNGRKLVPFTHPNGFTSYHLYHGTLAEALDRLRYQRDRLLWPLRMIGSLLIWVALAFLAPIKPIAERSELLQQLHRPLLPLLLLPFAAIVSALLILLLDVLFSMWIGAAAAVALVFALMLAERWIIRNVPIPSGPVDPRAPVAAASLAQLPPALVSFQQTSAEPAQTQTQLPPAPALPSAPLSTLPAAGLPEGVPLSTGQPSEALGVQRATPVRPSRTQKPKSKSKQKTKPKASTTTAASSKKKGKSKTRR